VRLCLLVGGALSLAGWIVLAVGLTFVWIFVLNADWPSLVYFRSAVATTQGRVERVERTSWSQGKGRHRRRIYRVQFDFHSPYAKARTGWSYSVGGAPEPGTEITVEYVMGRPEIVRMKGLRCRPLPWGMVFFVAFPAVGGCLILIGLLRGAAACRLVREGVMTRAMLKSKEGTASRVNNQRVYKFTFEFTAQDGQTYEGVARTHKVEELEDESEERVVYDPWRPSRAVMLDALPASIAIDGRGEITAARPAALLARVALPTVTIVGHGVYLAYLLCR